MNYAIQYHETSREWLIFDIGEGFELVGVARRVDRRPGADELVDNTVDLCIDQDIGYFTAVNNPLVECPQ